MASKETRQFLKRIEKRGWTWEERRSGHLRLEGPRGEFVFCSATPSDHRALKNIERNMRMASDRISQQ